MPAITLTAPESELLQIIIDTVYAGKKTVKTSYTKLEAITENQSATRSELKIPFDPKDVDNDRKLREHVLNHQAKGLKAQVLDVLEKDVTEALQDAVQELARLCETESRKLTPICTRLYAELAQQVREQMMQIFSDESPEQVEYRIETAPKIQAAKAFCERLAGGYFRPSDVETVASMLTAGELPFAFTPAPHGGPPVSARVSFQMASV